MSVRRRYARTLSLRKAELLAEGWANYKAAYPLYHAGSPLFPEIPEGMTRYFRLQQFAGGQATLSAINAAGIAKIESVHGGPPSVLMRTIDKVRGRGLEPVILALCSTQDGEPLGDLHMVVGESLEEIAKPLSLPTEGISWWLSRGQA